MSFIAGFFLGFLFCFIAAYGAISRATQQTNENKSLVAQNRRLIDALRYSGGRISFYKGMNKSHLEKLRDYQIRKERIRELLR